MEDIEQVVPGDEQKEDAFFSLAEQFRSCQDPERAKKLGDEFGLFVFGK